MSGALRNPTVFNASGSEALAKPTNHFQFNDGPAPEITDNYPYPELKSLQPQMFADRQFQTTFQQEQDANSLMEHVQKRLLQLKQELHERQVALASRSDLSQHTGPPDVNKQLGSEVLSSPVTDLALPRPGTSSTGQQTPGQPPMHLPSSATGMNGSGAPGQDLWPYWSCLTAPIDHFGGDPLLGDKQAQSRSSVTPPASYCAPSGDRPTPFSEMTPRISSTSSAAPTGFTASSPLQATPVLSANQSSVGALTGIATPAAPYNQALQAAPVQAPGQSLAAAAQNVAAAAAQTAKVRFTPIIPPQVVGNKTALRSTSLQSNRDRVSLRFREKSGSSSGRDFPGRGRMSVSKDPPALSAPGSAPRMPIFQHVPAASPVDSRSISPYGRSRRQEQFQSPYGQRFSAASPTRSVGRGAASPGRRFVARASMGPGMPPVAVPVLASASTSFAETSSLNGSTPGIFPRASSSRQDLPEPGEVVRQKETHDRDIMSKFQKEASKLDEEREQQLANIRSMAEKGKQQYQQMMDQKVQNEELVLTQKFREQVMRLTQAAQARRAELERSAFAATLEYQQKKVEDMYLAQQSHMEQEYREAQEKISAEIQKLSAARNGPGLLGGVGMGSPTTLKPPLFSLQAEPGLQGPVPKAVPSMIGPPHERHTVGGQLRATSDSRVQTPGFRFRPAGMSPSHSFVATPTTESRSLQLSESHQGVSFVVATADVSPRPTSAA